MSDLLKLNTFMMQTELFEQIETDPKINVLPKDGVAHYFQGIFDDVTSDLLYQSLFTSLDWQPDELWMLGKKVVTQRKVAWIGDSGCSYTYSGVKKEPQAWTSELLEIKSKAEELVQWKFNSCLLNLYHNGNEGMGWHSDDEIELAEQAPIVSVSLGATRKFAFRHKRDGTSVSLFLVNGSALAMHAPTQVFWQHSLLKTKLSLGPRINLTFRAIQL
jgi:alkylated DNA repair dioxygenase AlkB